MSGHAVFSPSSLDLREACPGYQPSGESSAAASRGTDIHAIMAACIRGEIVGIPDELAEPVAFGEEAFEQIKAEFGEGADIYVEEQLQTDIHAIWGTTDVALVDTFAARGAIVDWKTGRGERKGAAESLQVAAYACGAAKRWGLESVDCYIVELDRRRITKATLSRADMDAALLRMRDVIRAAREDDPLKYRSGSFCGWCRRSISCPAVVAGSLVPVSTAPALPDAASMQPAEVAAFLDRYAERIDLAETILSQVKARAHAILEAGGEVPGWRLVNGKRTRKWENLATAADELEKWAESERIDKSDLYDVSLLSPAQVEKLAKSAKAVVASLVEVKLNPKLVKADEPKSLEAA